MRDFNILQRVLKLEDLWLRRAAEDLTMRPAGLWAPVWDLLVVPVLSLRNCGQLQPGHGQHFLGHGQNMGYGHLWHDGNA